MRMATIPRPLARIGQREEVETPGQQFFDAVAGQIQHVVLNVLHAGIRQDLSPGMVAASPIRAGAPKRNRSAPGLGISPPSGHDGCRTGTR